MVAVAGMLGLRARAYMAKRAAYMQQRSISTPSTPGIATEAPKAFKGSGRGGMPIPGEIPGGPKPIVYRGMVLNSKMVFFYSFLFIVPSFVTWLFYTQGKMQASREDIINSEAYKEHVRARFGEQSDERVAEMKAQMNKVLFETKGTLGKPEWAIKRDEERKRKADEKAEKAAADKAAGKSTGWF